MQVSDVPNLSISDAGHGGAGGFYFLPPMIKNPRPFAGSFDGSLSPVVRICRWVDAACVGPDIVFGGGEPGARGLERAGQQYHAKWKDTHDLSVGDVYRLQVFADAAATAPLGQADLLIVAKNRDEKRVPAGFIGVARGLPFHIKFRIEKGAQPPDPDPDPDPDAAPEITARVPAAGTEDVARNADLSLTFSEPVNVTGDWFQIFCSATGLRLPASTAVSGGPTTFTINPNADFFPGETCTVTVFAAGITDQDTNDPPDNMAENYVFEFLVSSILAPAPLDDGPAPNSVPGDDFHTFVGVPIQVLPPGLLANDALGSPAGQIVSFGGGSLGGSAGAFPAGETVNYGLDGELTVLANGGVAFRPYSGFSGAFTFQYRVTNEHGSGDATVTIWVGERP